MKSTELRRALEAAVQAARKAGQLMRENLHSAKRINEEHHHDIKLELDVRCQNLIQKHLQRQFPGIPLLGEEGDSGDPNAPARWVVDPIDGTVNFTYGIPHACVSIALQAREEEASQKQTSGGTHQTLVGTVYDPFCDELWTAIRGQSARLNGRLIHVSNRRLRESIVSVGFSKKRETIEKMLPVMESLLHRVRKIRITGSAALALVYVATGRFDAYVEAGVRLWDIAAGGLIVECAGGEFWRRPIPGDHSFEILANNGLLRRQISLGLRHIVH
jgi:myo-inositol-1(or 4)-monophosphatase